MGLNYLATLYFQLMKYIPRDADSVVLPHHITPKLNVTCTDTLAYALIAYDVKVQV
jgi:hypothetical protein